MAMTLLEHQQLYPVAVGASGTRVPPVTPGFPVEDVLILDTASWTAPGTNYLPPGTTHSVKSGKP